jgi:hypothetical protein
MLNQSTTLRPSPNLLLSDNVLGQTVAAGRRGGGWRHPWFTQALWLPKRKTWAVFVLAGFVNGVAPVVRVSAADVREARGAFFGQLVDARSGAAEIAQLAELAIGSDEVVGSRAVFDVPLYENPPIFVNGWRTVGYGGEGRVPLFFQDRGVNQPPGTPADQVAPPPPRGNHRLAACDVWLQQPRVALTSSLEINPVGAVAGTTLVQQTLAQREPAGAQRLRIQTGQFEEIAGNLLNFRGAGSLLADYEEKDYDQVKVATVWMVSPPDTPESASPDATWTPYVEHALFWNLSWSQPLLREAVFSSDIFAPLLGTLSLLGGGSGFLWASSVTAGINDAVQGAYNVLAATSLAGSFWTATGGGTTSAWPVTSPEVPSTGVDKAARRAARARAAAQERLNRRLDPAFPYEGMNFNRGLLKG